MGTEKDVTIAETESSKDTCNGAVQKTSKTKTLGYMHTNETDRTDTSKDKCRNGSAPKPNGAITTDTFTFKLNLPKRKDNRDDKMDAGTAYGADDYRFGVRGNHGEGDTGFVTRGQQRHANDI